MKPMEYGNMIDKIERLRKQLDAVLNEIPKNMAFARQEGIKQGYLDGRAITDGQEKEAYAAGFAEALEKAAKMCDCIEIACSQEVNIVAALCAEKLRSLKSK